VVAVEVTDDPGWDFVPFPPAVLDPIMGPRAAHMRRIKNSFWFTHQANNSKARVHYGDACNLPDALGTFDIAVMAAVLLHTRSPLAIIAECAKRSQSLVISDLLLPELEGSPVCRLHPTRENKSWDTWWHFSTDFLAQFIGVLGYDDCTITRHTQTTFDGQLQVFFTIVARRR
jgi:O-methyltransferase